MNSKSSHRRNQIDIYWISISVIDLDGPGQIAVILSRANLVARIYSGTASVAVVLQVPDLKSRLFPLA